MRRLLLVIVFGAACVPDLGARDSLVTKTSILAVRGEPPEGPTGTMVRYEVLVATPDGPVAAPPAAWAYCTSAKLLTENGAVSAACLRDAGARRIAGGGAMVESAIPDDACRVFGPDVSAQDLRPRDPDITGGFYQPVRVAIPGAMAFALERVSCKAAGIAADQAADLGMRYVANKNPVLLPLEATLPFDAVPRGARVTLKIAWPPETAETYALYDVASRSVVDRRESIRVSWFATAGAFDVDRTGRAEAETATSTENTWTAPADARAAYLFVIARDARGGTTFLTQAITVK